MFAAPRKAVATLMAAATFGTTPTLLVAEQPIVCQLGILASCFCWQQKGPHQLDYASYFVGDMTMRGHCQADVTRHSELASGASGATSLHLQDTQWQFLYGHIPGSKVQRHEEHVLPVGCLPCFTLIYGGVYATVCTP